MSAFNQKTRSLVSVIVLIVLIVLTVSGVTQSFLNSVGFKHLQDHNKDYLKQSSDRSLATFLVLSGIKTGLAIMEGSEVGVGFGLEVGDAVQAAYDIVDIAWRIVLASSAILIGTQFLLLASQLLEPWFLGATLILILLTRLITWIRPNRASSLRPVRDLAMFAAIITIALYLVLPLSIYGGSLLSGAITAKAIQEADTNLTDIRKDLFPENEHSLPGLLGKLQDAKNKFDQATHLVMIKMRDMNEQVLKLIAGYLFDTIIFPLVLFLLLFHLTRIVTRYIFNTQRQQSFHKDLDKLLSKYFKAGERNY